jgi:hypothetical protein
VTTIHTAPAAVTAARSRRSRAWCHPVRRIRRGRSLPAAWVLTRGSVGLGQLPAAALDDPVDDGFAPEVLGVDDGFGDAPEPPSEEEPPEEPESFEEDEGAVAGVEVDPEDRESVR